MITFAVVARLRTVAYSVVSRPGMVLLIVAWAVLIAPSQLPSQAGFAHSVITEVKPASLPPTWRVTKLTAAFSGPSWLAVTSATRAPEQATEVRVAPIRAASTYG
jgi:hypothetical protein